MKVGILSMQRIHNYGSLLQAYALKRILEGQGHEVTFVDIITKDGMNLGHNNSNIIHKLINKRQYLDRYFIRRVINSKKNSDLNKVFVESQKKYLAIGDEFMGAAGLDAVVIGSDEIFNSDSGCRWGITGQRFGNIPEVKTTISYAASCGYAGLGSCSAEEKEEISIALGKLKAISVRDDNTQTFVERIACRSAEINLDPVLIYGFEEEMRKVESVMAPPERYMVVYAYHNRISLPEEIHEIKKYAHNNKLKTIAIGGSQPWCDDFVILDPFQVLNYFKNAECIVTDTFHGVVMSAKFNKTVAVLIRNSNRNKLEDLVKRLKIKSACADTPSNISEILCQQPDYEASNRIVDTGRKIALNYLRDNLPVHTYF